MTYKVTIEICDLLPKDRGILIEESGRVSVLDLSGGLKAPLTNTEISLILPVAYERLVLEKTNDRP